MSPDSDSDMISVSDLMGGVEMRSFWQGEGDGSNLYGYSIKYDQNDVEQSRTEPQILCRVTMT